MQSPVATRVTPDVARRASLVRRADTQPSESSLEASLGDDYVGGLIPFLRDWPKVRQLEVLKQMLLWPGDKLAFQFPSIMSNRHLGPDDRRAMASEIATALVDSLQSEGIRYELPDGFRPTGESVPPPSPDDYPRPE